MPTIEPVQLSLRMSLSPERAFDRFVRELRDWWPRDYTWGGEALEDIGIDPREGGLCYELGPHGFRCDWGRVLAWEPPAHVRLAWQISPRREPVPDPRHASTLSVRFAPEAGGTTVLHFVHDGFERHGPDAAAYREAMASPQGWPLILQRYLDASA